MSVGTLLTAEQLWELPDVPGKRFELIDGELVEMPAAGMLHGLIVGIVYRLLAAAAGEHGRYAFGDGVGYVLARRPDVVRVPDASYVAAENVPEGGIPLGFGPFAPDLAVEVVSPNDRAGEVHAKVREYLDAGTRLVWVLWPGTRGVTVTTADGMSRELGPDDVSDGGVVLPGLQVPVVDLFPTAD